MQIWVIVHDSFIIDLNQNKGDTKCSEWLLQCSLWGQRPDCSEWLNSAIAKKLNTTSLSRLEKLNVHTLLQTHLKKLEGKNKQNAIHKVDLPPVVSAKALHSYHIFWTVRFILMEHMINKVTKMPSESLWVLLTTHRCQSHVQTLLSSSWAHSPFSSAVVKSE